jgi:hypothetical protein
MPRPNIRRLVKAVLREKGPLTDAELAWWLGVVFKANGATARKKRRELTKKKEVQFASKVKITASGHVQKLWELAPHEERRLVATNER